MADDFPDILDTAQAAAFLQVNVDTLRRWVREGSIPAHRLAGGREMRFLREELLQWVRDQPSVGRTRDPAEPRLEP